MRRLLGFALSALVATAAWASDGFFLDREGTLWNAAATAEGLVLTGTRDGATAFSSSVPFPVALNGVSDSNIRVAADELTGSVVVVWQRTWTPGATEILAAMWRNGDWVEVGRVSEDVFANPRNPDIRLASAQTTLEDGTVVSDSFLEIAWWEGAPDAHPHGELGIIRLSAEDHPISSATRYDLDDFVPIALSCRNPAPDDVLEHPLFASTPGTGDSLLFFGSSGDCLFYLVGIDYRVLDNPPDGGSNDGIVVSAQRRRHWPIFGVRKAYLMPMGFNLTGARILIGADLNPVAYRVDGSSLLYVVSHGLQWSDPRTLDLSSHLTVEQAIPLVEGLAR